MPPSEEEAITDRNICIIWFITIAFFIIILIGGILLILYIILPASATTSWFPVVGMALICVPWTFWIFMCVYRSIVVRCCCSSSSNASNRAAAVVPAGGGSSDGSDQNGAEMVDSPGGGARRVRFGNAVVLGGAADADAGACTGAEGNMGGMMPSEGSSSESENTLTLPS